ncbi:MAG: glutamate racemase [Bacteroidales bacterium]
MIGVFDSGLGGLTVLRAFLERLPQYDYLYLGDNARSPYGTRSFETVFQFTKSGVDALFKRGCRLVILACNTASAKALRNIQQKELPNMEPGLRVLGVIRPCVEALGSISHTGVVGILGTPGTIQSESYPLEIKKIHPDLQVFQQACPMWVPLVENNEQDSPGADYFVQKEIDALLSQHRKIDTVVMGCTHYPLLEQKIRKYLPSRIHLVAQGPIVANSLADYLIRHPEIETRCTKEAKRIFLTTEVPAHFNKNGSRFLQMEVASERIEL